MTPTIRLGISTCPNDTFAFHGLMSRLVDWRGLEFSIELMDVEELNQRLLAGALDVAKASFHAALRLSREYVVIPCGSALGFGVGPLLLSRHAAGSPDSWAGTGNPLVLCPGSMTTATMLYQLFFPGFGEIRQVVFSEIMPRLRSGAADFGVCIHEGRFTWQESGLLLVADLGALWEAKTGMPLPLGGILGSRKLGDDVLGRVCQVIGDSLAYGHAHPDEAMNTMRRYAQELGDDVLARHVSLYVNAQTTDLGESGRRALAVLSRLALEQGLIGENQPALEVSNWPLP